MQDWQLVSQEAVKTSLVNSFHLGHTSVVQLSDDVVPLVDGALTGDQIIEDLLGQSLVVGLELSSSMVSSLVGTA